MIFNRIFLILILLYGTACQVKTQPSEASPFAENLKYLVKEELLLNHFTIGTDGGISFYANAFDKENEEVECRIYPEEIREVARLLSVLSPDSALIFYKEKKNQKLKDLPGFLKYLKNPPSSPVIVDSLKPLKGKRIAIDPGHIEAEMSMAELEGKFIKIKASNETGLVPLAFNEANLTLATARLLSEKLIQEGAEVFITRPLPGIGMMGKTFEEWYNTDRINTVMQEVKAGRIDSIFAYYILNEASREEIYQRFYVPVDLRIRAEKINDFRPDLTVIIHYNVHGPNWEQRDNENYLRPTEKNYCMTFVPGSFKGNELYKVEDRSAFLRLLLTPDLKESIAFSENVTQEFVQKLGVPPVMERDSLGYLKNSCILTGSPGVYARNLNLTRNIKGVLCYGESLCQDNITESAWLNQRLIKAGDIQTSSRAKMVAEAYFEGIRKYYKNKK
ncbi:MAG: N-acetylmuramoyl-L-alanine amidase [Bacteroidia bacterium]|nr:N-acetylmuramoyl-L-alanine amidase [Bacteroidia bacterium]